LEELLALPQKSTLGFKETLLEHSIGLAIGKVRKKKGTPTLYTIDISL